MYKLNRYNLKIFGQAFYKRLAGSRGGALVALRRARNSLHNKAQEGSQNSPVDCFDVGDPRRGSPVCKAMSGANENKVFDLSIFGYSAFTGAKPPPVCIRGPARREAACALRTQGFAPSSRAKAGSERRSEKHRIKSAENFCKAVISRRKICQYS